MSKTISPIAASPRNDALPARDVPAPVARPARRILRFAGYTLGALAGLAVIAAAGVFGVAEWKLGARRDYVAMPLEVAPSPALVAEGERNFHIFGCFGCHGEKGNVLFDEPIVARVTAPDLREKVRLYDDEGLVDLVRRGIKHDGTSAIVMPINTTGRISDDDLAAIVAYLGTLPEPSGGSAAPTAIGPLGYVALAAGKVVLSADIAPAEVPPRSRPAGHEGEYLVGSICRECHNLDTVFDNGFDLVAPALRDAVPSYSPQQFASLLRTGKGLDGQDLGPMSEVSRLDFSHFTDEEIGQIYAYLTAN